MVIRPIWRDELALFAHLSDDIAFDKRFEGYLDDLWADGSCRPEWCFLAEQDGRILGRVGYWALPSFAVPMFVEFLLLPWDGDYLETGVALLKHTLAHFHALGARDMACQLHIPSHLRIPSDRCAKVLERAGFVLIRSGDRWERTNPTAPVVSWGRLVFRTLDEVGEDALVAAIQRVTTGTLDRSLQRDLRLLGPERAAREEFHYARAMLYKPGWWRLAYIPKGTLAGLIMVAENDGGPIIYYIGVVPEQRGRGYVDDLLVEGTLLLQAEGATRIIADTDTENAPMARAFERAGYRKFGTRLDYAIQLTRLHEDVD